MTTYASIINFNQHADATAVNRQRTTDVTITEMFHVGYRDGRNSVDELSRATSNVRGLADGLAGKPASYDPEVHENVTSVVTTCAEHGAYAFGWDVGWRDEVFARLMYAPGV